MSATLEPWKLLRIEGTAMLTMNPSRVEMNTASARTANTFPGDPAPGGGLNVGVASGARARRICESVMVCSSKAIRQETQANRSIVQPRRYDRPMRSYGQYCSVAKALDVLGE